MTREKIEKLGEQAASELGYNIHSLNMDVLNVKTSFCVGYSKGSSDKELYAMQQAVVFIEWVALNRWKRERTKSNNGRWYIPSAGYGGGEPMMYNTEQLYNLFEQSKTKE